MDVEKILNEMTVEEKAAIVAGTDFMFTNPLPRLNVPSLRMADGPHGLRMQTGKADNGIAKSHPATAFPTAATLASSWNESNAYAMGEAIAAECKHYGVSILLGPGVNIKRNAKAGRNFEYFSEDPLLAGKMAAAEVRGVQDSGIGVSVKHFALNNSENFRFMGDSVADERAMREIYLKPFEIVVKESKPYTLMCAYNKINGTYCSENGWLLTDILRNEWAFDGAVMTDWGAIRDRVDALKAGLDLEMPGDTPVCRRRILDGIASGELSMADLDKAARNVLHLVDKCVRCEVETPNWHEHHRLSADIAADCAVLLKNDGTLPLKCDQKYLVVGELFEKMRYQGAGSSMINPIFLTSPKDAFDSRGIKYEYSRGYAASSDEICQELIDEAVKMASSYDTVLTFVGLTDLVESEGCDRADMSLPKNQLALVDALCSMGKRVVVVLYGGSIVELPFESKVNAIMDMFLPGQNGGEATASLLFGERSPSGRLAQTWMRSYEDTPFGSDFSQSAIEVYKESVFVGYRYFVSANKPVLYPFGYGLSYTKFEYSDITASDEGELIKVSCTVRNMGATDGAEVVQVYVKPPESAVFRPQRELKAFKKVYIRAGQSVKVELSLPKSELAYFDVKRKEWVIEDGEYSVQLCSDCVTVIAKADIVIGGEKAASPYNAEVDRVYRSLSQSEMTDELFEQMSGVKIPHLPPVKPINVESRFSDLRCSFMGRVLYSAVTSIARRQIRKAKRMKEGVEKDNQIKGGTFLLRIFESNSLRAMSMSAGTRFPFNFAQGFAHMANGKIFKGIGCIFSKIKVPPLPKDEKKDRKNRR